ncbi:Double-stranded RNA-binding protein 1 [Linum grandiflorum]
MSNGYNGGRPPHHASSSSQQQQQPVVGKRPRPDDGISNCYLFKSQLQECAQKAGVPMPVYETTKEGPSHAPFFRSTVIVNDVRYDSLPGFMNRKAAEQSAAEVALIEIAKTGDANASISQPAHGTGLCKNLLQEYAQKMNFAVPMYLCQPCAPQHGRRGHSFQCTVDVGGTKYIGAVANTKKEAEIKAARTALLAIREISTDISGGPTGNSSLTVIPNRNRVLNAPQETATATPPAAKKRQRKKNMMKRKPHKKRKNALGEPSSNANPAEADQMGLEVPKSASSEHIDNNCETADDQQGSECKRVRVSEPEGEGMEGVTGESVVEEIKGAVGESKDEGVVEGMSGAIGEMVLKRGNERREGVMGESEIEGVDKRMDGAIGEGMDEGTKGAIGESEVEGVDNQMKGAIGESKVEGVVEGMRGAIEEMLVEGGNERREGAIGGVDKRVEGGIGESKFEGMRGDIGEIVVKGGNEQIERAIGESEVEGVDNPMKGAIGEMVVEGGNERREGAMGESEVEGVDKRVEGGIGESKVEGVDEGIKVAIEETVVEGGSELTEHAIGESSVEGGDKRTECGIGESETEGMCKRNEGSTGESKVEGVSEQMEDAVGGSHIEGVPSGSIVETVKVAVTESVVEGVETALGAPGSDPNATPENCPEPALQTGGGILVEGEGGISSAVEIPAPDSNLTPENRSEPVLQTGGATESADVGVAGGSDDGQNGV